MPAPNRCQLSAVPKQEQILLDRGQRAVNPRLTKVNWPSEAGPATVNRTPPRPGRSGDGGPLGPFESLGHQAVRPATGRAARRFAAASASPGPV